MKKYEQLEKIQNLKEKGVLSESEFEEEKEKLLNAETFDVKGKTHQKVRPKIKNIGLRFAGFIISLIIIIIGFFIYLHIFHNESGKGNMINRQNSTENFD